MSGPEGTEGEVAGTMHSQMVHIQALAGLVHTLTLAGLVHTLTLAGPDIGWADATCPVGWNPEWEVGYAGWYPYCGGAP